MLTTKMRCASLIALMSVSMSMFAQATVNLAQKAIKVNVSVNADEASLLADNGRVTYWSTEGANLAEYQYVEFEWSSTSKVEEANVYWAKPKAAKGIALPADAYLAYWDGEDWVKDASLNAIDDASVTSINTEVQTKKLRIYMLRTDSVCGLREVRLMGSERAVPGELYEWPEYSCPQIGRAHV